MATLFGAQTERKKKQGAALFGGGGTLFGNFDTESVQRQIDNATLRIQDSGYKVANSDGRNMVERALNLPSGQNAFFDTLEVLQRPFQGVANVVDKSLFNGTQNPLQAFGRGISGQDKVRGTDLAENMQITNPVQKAVVGTALEIGLDPVTYVPGGVIAKGAKAATKPVRATAKFAFDNARKIPAVNKGVEKLTPLVESAKDKLGYMFNPDHRATETLFDGQSDFLTDTYRKTENDRRFMQEEFSNRLLKTAQQTGLDAGPQVGRTMESPLKQFEDVEGFRFPDGRTTENKLDLYNESATKRDEIKGIGQEISQTKREYGSAIGELAKGMDDTDNEIQRMLKRIDRVALKTLNKETRSNMNTASREIRNIQKRLDNFAQNEVSLLKHFKKQIAQRHESRFDLAKMIRKAAPNGIKGVGRDSMPTTLQNLIRAGGKGIDEVADELGYQTADDLIQDLSALNGLPRRLDDAEIDRLARAEMERTGALEDLYKTKDALMATRNTMTQAMKDIKRTNNTARAEQQALVELSNNPRYQELIAQREALKSQKDSLLNESKQLKAERVKRIKDIEKEMEALREAARKPVTLQKEFQRPSRELSSDPAIQKAAQDLVQSNAELRAYAAAEGISVNEIEGYMTHVLSQAEREFRKKNKVIKVDQGQFNTGNPNKKILERRKNLGSVEDVNERKIADGLRKEGHNYFEPNAYFATAIGQRRLIDYIQAVSFRKKVLNNPDFAMKLKDFKSQYGEELPANSAIIDVNNYKFIKPDGDLMEEAAKQDIGGEYVVTKAVKEKLDRYKYAMTDEGSKAFLRGLDTAQSWWKRLALFSVPYHIRNDVGAKFNLWVGGMSAVDIAKYSNLGYQEAFNAMVKGNESSLYREYRKQGLSSTAQSQVEFARYGQEPEEAIEKLVKEGSKDLKGKIKDRLNPLRAFETSRELGDFIDQSNRFAMFKWAVEKKGLDHEKAAEMVRETLFDYTRLTNFERQFMTRIMPFYRWMRNNLPFQIRKFVADPRKYANLNKARLNAQEAVGIDEEEVPDYMKEGFAMPVWMSEEGKGKMLGFNLPVGDLSKLSNPLKMGVDALTPAVKLPIELSSNFNLFRGKPIEQFQGQEKQFTLFGKDLGGIPIKTAYAAEQLTGQIGRGLSGYLQKPESVDQDTKFRMPSFGISSVLKDFDVEAANYYELRDKLRQLQDYINYIEQQEGVRPRDVREIQKATR